VNESNELKMVDDCASSLLQNMLRHHDPGMTLSDTKAFKGLNQSYDIDLRSIGTIIIKPEAHYCPCTKSDHQDEGSRV